VSSALPSEQVTQRWIVDRVQETKAARRIARTRQRNKPAVKLQAAAYAKTYQQRPEVKARRLLNQRRRRAELHITPSPLT
jgi:hypothetical protein